jgi:hypothetical protein
MTNLCPPKIGIAARLWDEAVEGFTEDTNKTITFFDDVTHNQKTITLAGPNVLGAMCGYCCAGPMKLTNLYSRHFAKAECDEMIFEETSGKYVRKHGDGRGVTWNGHPANIGMKKECWVEAVEGFEEDTNETIPYFDEITHTQKTITLAGPNVMGAMCGYCGAGPMKLMNLYSHHYGKGKCKAMFLVS